MITLVGAGPVGSLWALLLKQLGQNVRVFEKRPDPRKSNGPGGRSINLIVTSRGLHALSMAGLTSLVDHISVPVYGRMVHTKSGELNYQPYGQKNECNYSISRGELNNALITEAEKAGVEFSFDHSLLEVDTNKKNLVFENIGDKKNYNFEILFGSDGSGSQLRKQMTAKFSDVRDETQWLEADYKELNLPLSASGKPALKVDALHIWPRGAHMLMALANKDGSFTMTVYIPKNSENTRSEWGFNKIQTQEQIKAFFESEFADAIPLMPNYLSEFMNNPTGVLGTVRCNRWVFENTVALIGDAAHAIVPFFGQGMNCGFEDCTVLFDLFRKHQGQWVQILSDYEKIQKPNADAIANMALENWIEMRDKVGDNKFLMRKKLESALESRHPGFFKSRYGLITYTLTPYLLAQKAGDRQGKILDELLNGVNNLDEVSWERADHLIQTDWAAFIKENQLDLKTYKI